jgi:hypothetical protein
MPGNPARPQGFAYQAMQWFAYHEGTVLPRRRALRRLLVGTPYPRIPHD